MFRSIHIYFIFCTRQCDAVRHSERGKSLEISRIKLEYHEEQKDIVVLQ